MSSLKQIAAAFTQLAFTVVGYIIAGPIGAFIGSVIGSFAAKALFGSGKRGTDNSISKVNVRVNEPIRWLHAGWLKAGGAVLFAEHDSAGNLWYLVVHGDTILGPTDRQYMLDDVLVTLDGSGNVLTKDFRLKNNKKKDPAETDGEGVGYVQVWTTTYTASDPTPPAIAALAAAFPGKWTSDHKLVGTTYSVVKMKALDIEHRHKIYRWRGPLGLGEPSIAIIGKWHFAYDPRDVTQTLGDPTTYKFTRNAELIWAWFRTHRYGRNKPESSINWDMVAEQADVCDEVVTGISGDHVRYQCDASIPEDRQRSDAEQAILLSMDAQLVFDEDGKCWARAGRYETPTLTLYRNRDIVAMEGVEADNGESETQGVIVRFTDPNAKYEIQPSAPWYNPLYYTPGEAATFAVIDIPEIQDHNQAMRIAKAIGMRQQPLWKCVPTTGLRGLKAMRERIINQLYDNVFTGDCEIVTQVEVDESGQLCRFGLVPVDEDRWTLLPGEEQGQPIADEGDPTDPPDVPTGVTLAYVAGQITAEFDPPTRDDVTFEFQYVVTADIATDVWIDMTVQMADTIAYSGVVPSGVAYTVRWRAVSGSGLPSAFDDDEIDVPPEELILDGGDPDTEVG